MSILRAIFLTLLLIIIYYIPQGIIVLLDKNTELIGKGFGEHIFAFACISYVIAYSLVFYLFWRPRPAIKNIFEARQIDLGLIPYLVLIVIGIGFIDQPFSEFFKIVDYYRYSKIEVYAHPKPFFDANLVYRQISTLIIAPVLEELFFRKFLFKKLLEKNGLFIAVVISSLCFSAIHFERPSSLIPIFIGGIIYALIYYRTKNIIYLMLMHFCHNFIVLLYSIYGEAYFTWLNEFKFDLMYWAVFIFGILIVVLGMNQVKLATENTDLSE